MKTNAALDESMVASLNQNQQIEELRHWASQCLPGAAVFPAGAPLSAINGDAGFRQYFRCPTQPSFMAVYAPPRQEDNPAFVAKGLALAAAQVAVPRVYAVNFQKGYMLQQDLGDRLLQPLLNNNSMPTLYDAAEDMIRKVQRVAANPQVFPSYDKALLLQEMALFPEWFVEQLLGVSLNEDDKTIVAGAFDILTASALAQPQVVVHRDYHCRNLLLQNDGSMGVIDFQDAVVGPFSYDLVSLLKDCYIHWPESVVKQRALAFLSSQCLALEIPTPEPEQLMRWFDFMGLQRHIKVLGIFARLWLRDGKAAYLQDLPLVVNYTLQAMASYPELANFQQWFVRRLQPLIEQQPWYVEPKTAGEHVV